MVSAPRIIKYVGNGLCAVANTALMENLKVCHCEERSDVAISCGMEEPCERRLPQPFGLRNDRFFELGTAQNNLLRAVCLIEQGKIFVRAKKQ